jgi:hypothetical protein
MPKSSKPNEKKIFLSLSPFMLCLNSEKETKRREKEKKQKIIHKALPHRGSIT